MKYRKTKIVCTLGPATDEEEVLRGLILAGMDVARFNFSHGTHEEQKARLKKLKKLRDELGRPVAALLDTKGPEIRLGLFEDGKAVLEEGQEFTLTTEETLGNAKRAMISYANLANDLSVGKRILIDDGLIEMEVIRIEGTEITCRVINGGPISNRKGVNVPDVELSMPYISKQDYEDILFGIEQDYDFIAASFVRKKEDVLELRRILEEKKGSAIKIISKIENMQGVRNIDEIIEVSDGIMVARGDMGVEIPFEDVPGIQKLIIRKVLKAGKHVITATQMLDSMMKHPRPTRAETADVANAIYDGTGAIMLSGETAAGDYPIEAVKTMAKIALRTEADIDYDAIARKMEELYNPDITNAICHATCTISEDLHAAAILTVTKSGATANMVSKYRPLSPIVGGTLTRKVYRQLNLCWGVIPLLLQEKEELDELFAHAVNEGKNAGILERGDKVVITAGVPLGVSGTTNLVKVQEVE